MVYTTPRTWVTAETVTATQMNTHIRDNFNAGFPVDPDAAEDWTPDLEATSANPDTTVTGRKWRVGPMQKVMARFVMSSTNNGVGTFFVTLPVAASGITAAASSFGIGQALGTWRGADLSNAAASEVGVVFLASSTTVRFALHQGGSVDDDSPFMWDQTDVLTFEAEYPVA